MSSPGIMPDSQTSTRQIPDNSGEPKIPVPEIDLAHFLARQEALLREICNKFPTRDKATEVGQQEIKLLEAIYKQVSAPRETNTAEFAWNSILKTVGLALGVMSAAFGVLSYTIGGSANKLSSEQNQLSLLSLCFSTNSTDITESCAQVSQKATESIAALITAVFGPTITTTAPSAPSSVPKLSDRIALGVGIPVSLFGLGMALLSYRSKVSQYRTRNEPATDTYAI